MKVIRQLTLTILTLIVLSSYAAAATYTVNRADDLGDGVCDATCTLRDAITTANVTEPLDDLIVFDSSLTTITLNNEIAIDQSGRLSITGPGADRLTINGGPGSNRIFYTFTSLPFSSELNISDLTLSGGNGDGAFASGFGGAIYANASGLRFNRVHITGNTASSGGGVYYNATGLGVFDTTFSNNSSTGDCGGFNNRGDGLMIENSTISGNTAGGDGGGFCHINSGSLSSSTITNNTALRGGGIALLPLSGTLNVTNSIIAGNNFAPGGSGPEIYKSAASAMLISNGFDLVGDSTGDSADTGFPITYQANDILDTPPQLIALGNYGGTTPTHALQVTSPARDAADPLQGQGFDQRGLDRDAGVWDIGAFELQDNLTWYVTETADSNGICDETCSLREAIAAAPSGGTVEFAPNFTSTTPIIISSEIVIDKDLTISGYGADKIVIGTDISNHRIFFANALHVNISGVTLTGGAADSGGAIYVLGGFLTVDGVHFLSNAASGNGGGIYFSPGGFSHVIRNSTFSQNDAPGGGFGCNSTGTSNIMQVTVVNSTFTSNFSITNGAAIYNNRCNVTARNITVSGNNGINNGGIFVTAYGTFNIGNSIVSGNSATSPDPVLNQPEMCIFNGGSVTSTGNNLIGDSAGDATDTFFPITYQPSDILDTPSLLGSLQNNGGTTPTMALLLGSPAIDSGDNAKAVDPRNNSPLLTDQRGAGFNRIVNSVDIGALEDQTANTPAGTNVSVSPAANVTVTFAQVTTAGNTLATPIAGPPPPSGFQVDGVVYDITTTAVYVPPVIVCLSYDPLNPSPGIWHYEGAPPAWVNVTTSIDAVNFIVCGQVSSLSPFAVMQPVQTPTPTPTPIPTPTPTPAPDADGDGAPDALDNCPMTPNPNQADNDNDGQGDACDPDDDNDSQTDADEIACGSDPLSAASTAPDNDGDNSPDCVDPDDDNDGVLDGVDNCPLTPNPGQTDSDSDGIGDACDPTPTPTQTIVFSRLDGSTFKIFKMNSDGTNVTRLTSGSFLGDYEPALSPDGSKVAFTRARFSGLDIYRMNIDGSGLVRLSSSGFGIDKDPAWSPDGTRIVFSSFRFAGFSSLNNSEILVMDADGSNVVRLTINSAQDSAPAWSPDGTKIAFTSNRFGNLELLVMNADGSGTPTRLTNDPAADIDPSWSPDGTRLAFTTNRDGNFEIYSIDINTGVQTRLTNRPGNDTEPSWGANGKILFSSVLAGTGNRYVHVMNADGSNIVVLAQGVWPDW